MEQGSGEFREYLEQLLRVGQALEQEALGGSTDRTLPLLIGSLLIVIGICWGYLRHEFGEPWLWYTVPAVLGLCILPLKFRRALPPDWAFDRQQLCAHIHERVFALGQLRAYIAGQGNQQGSFNTAGLNRESLGSFIEFFIGSSFIRGRGYRYLGRVQHSRSLVRALLMQVIAAELLQGLSVFGDSDEGSIAVASAPGELIQRRGWQPPGENELVAALGDLQREQLSHLRGDALVTACGIALVSGVGVYGLLETYQFEPRLWPAIAGGLLLAVPAYFAALWFRSGIAHDLRRRHSAELEWEIFHNGLLRDYLHNEPGQGSIEQLRDFAQRHAQSLQPREDGSRNALPTHFLILDLTLRGILYRRREEPQEFEDW